MSKQKDKPIVVISGMSGRFPGVNSVADYAESLFNKKNLISSTKGRYPTDGLFEELPDAIGRVEDLEKFDNNFFNIKPELAHLMDPQARKMLEVTIEAILDAGLSLDDVKTTRTGSFFANIFNDIDRSLTPEHFSHRLNKCSDPSIAFYKQIFQQWVSYCLDLKGPAYHYESACSSALYALSDAFKAIESGLLDTCLIVTANMNVVPSVILQYLRLGIMSKSGVCRFADENADGYVKSETCCCIVIQRYDPKLNDVKRIYSRIVNTRCNSDGFKMEGITFPNEKTQYKLIKETFDEVGLEPTQVNYVEAHGTSTQTGDIQELNCIDRIFNDEVNYSKRKSPLYVGSVKSNIGHAEGGSGLCSIIKSLFCFMYDTIPPVVNYEKPNPNVPALLNDRIRIVVDNMPLNTDLISVSSFGFGGSNTHVILQNGKSIASIKDNHLSSRKLNCLDGYQLINLASRTEQGLIDGLNKLAQQFRSYDINLNEIYLLNDVVYREQIKLGFNQTGHIILNLKNLDDESLIHVNEEEMMNRNLIDYHNESNEKNLKSNKLFFAFPGLGCQWNGMAVGLLDIPFFSRRLKELCQLIQPELEFDIHKLMIGELKNETLDLSDSIFCLIAVAIYQISLLDLLRECGLNPDGYMGHSFGELICAYCDNICTAKQVLEATLVVCKLKHRYEETDKQNKPINNYLFEKGQMAVVGLDWESTLKEIKESKLQKVNAACNNTTDLVTISGVDKEVEEFLVHLTKKNIFNRKIASCGMAFHCDLVKDFYDYLLKEFNKIFKNQVKRTSKWISTSIDPFSEQENVSWLNDDPSLNRKEKQTFAQYFANCILQPVLFRESCEKMASDIKAAEQKINKVFVLELSPRSFLMGAMKNNVSKISSSITYLPGFSIIKKEDLYKKPNTNLLALLKAIGILNENGFYSSLSKLYQQQPQQQQINGHNSFNSLKNGLTNGCQTNDHLNKKNKTNLSASLSHKSTSITNHDQPIITNHLSISSLIKWDHSVDFLVPAWPDFFNNDSIQNKIDLNTVDFRHYLPESTTKFRLPISFYLDLLISQFKKKNSEIKFSSVHINDLMINHQEEINEEQLKNTTIELIEFSEQSSNGQIYVFLIKNYDKKLILSGNLAVSTMKINHQLNSDQSTKHQLSCDRFYEEMNLNDTRHHLITNDLTISTDQIKTQLNTDEWIKQLDGLIQFFIYLNNKSIEEINKQIIQIHSITIQLDSNDSPNDNLLIYNKQMNIGQSNQIELKCIQLNHLIVDQTSDLIMIDQNNNVEFKNKQKVLDDLADQKIKADYFKITKQLNLSYIGHLNQNQPVIGLLNKENEFDEKSLWQLDKSDLSKLSLIDGYLIASYLLNSKCKLNYTLESAFLNCDENLDLLIALCDLLTNCEIYVLIKDQTKFKLIRDCFSTRKNLHIITTVDPSRDDFDLELLRLTNGEGTQLVVAKSSSIHEFNKSLNCLSLNGKFININNEQICVNNTSLGMALFLKNVDFHGLTLNELDETVIDEQKNQMKSILNSINPLITQTLNQFNQFDLEKLFNTTIFNH